MKKLHLIYLFLFFNLYSFSQKKWNYIDIHNDSTFKDLTNLDDLNNDFRLFFSGENHTFQKSNLKLELKLLKYFHQKHQVNNLLLEFGDITGWLTNEYVTTGNPKLKEAIKIQFSDNFTKYFDKIKQYNDSLSEDNKIKIIGVDLQRSYSIGFEVLHYLLPSDSIIPADSILQQIELIKFLQGFNKSNLQYNKGVSNYYYRNYRSRYSNVKSFKVLMDNFYSFKQEYKAYLGTNFDLFERFIDKLKISHDNYSDNNSKTPLRILYREDYMYKQLTKLANKDTTQKFYGQFGRSHTYKNVFSDNYTYNFSSLVAKFNTYKENPLNGNVFSMGIYYLDLNSNIRNDSLDVNEEIRNELKKLKKDSVGLCKVTPNSRLDSALHQNYEYIIIHNGESKKEYKNYREEDYDYFVTSFNFTYGRRFINLSGIQNYFGLTDYASSLDYFGFAIATNTSILYNDFQFSSFRKVSRDISDTSSLGLTGFNATVNFGYDFLKSDRFDFILAGGLGYQELKLHLNQKVSSSGYNGIDDIDYNLVNPAFILGVSGELRIRIIEYFMAISLKAGYTFDVSSPKWKYKKNTLDFETNMSGLYTQFSICLGDFY